MNFFLKITLLSCFIAIVACNQTSSQSKGFTLKGKITNASGATVYLNKMEASGLTLTDSAKISDDGKFELSGLVDEPTLYSLMINNQNIVLALSNDAIDITGALPDFVNNYEVFNSEDSRSIKSFVKNLIQTQTQSDAINKRFLEAQQKGTANIDSVREVLTKEFGQITTAAATEQKAFVAKNKNNLAGVFGANYLNPRTDYDALKTLLEHLQKTKPTSKYTTQLASSLAPFAASQNVALGKVAPEINLNTPEGKLVALSSLRGKVVLIDFWASWCGPCRMENPAVVRSWNEYKDKTFKAGKGYEVFSVSLDNNGDRWKQAIKQDNLMWQNHVSDLKGWQSAAAQVYGVNSIPTNFLIDGKGVILAVGLRGEALQTTLKSLVKGQAAETTETFGLEKKSWWKRLFAKKD